MGLPIICLLTVSFRQAHAKEQAPGGQNRPYLPILQGKHLLGKLNRANLRIFVLKNGSLGGQFQFFQASSQEASPTGQA